MSVRYMGCPTCGQPWPTEPVEVRVTDAMLDAALGEVPDELVHHAARFMGASIRAALKAQEGASDE